ISLGTMDTPTVLFPTLSPDRAYTSWVVLGKISRFSVGAATNATIFFNGDKSFESQISTSSLNSQIARSYVISQHYSSLNQRAIKNIDLSNFTKIDRKAISKL
ncbi:MAG: competence protein ComK, partial [Kurthia sp.]